MAVSNGHLPLAQWLVTQGASGDERQYLGKTALLMACAYGSLPIVKWLINEGISSVTEKDTRSMAGVLLSASSHLETMKWLVENGHADLKEKDLHKYTALHYACIEGELQCAKWLIEQGLDPNEKATNYTPLHLAVYNGNFELAKWLVDHKGADPNVTRYRESVLVCACMGGDLRSVQWLIKEKNVPLPNPDEQSLLHTAIKHGCFDIVNWIVSEQICSITRVDKGGRTPLIFAAAKGHLNMVKKLMEHGASVTEKTPTGNTPLLEACIRGKLKLVKWLLYSGSSSLKEQNLTGQDAIQCTTSPGLKLFLEYFLNWDTLRFLFIGQQDEGSLLSMLPLEIIKLISKSFTL